MTIFVEFIVGVIGRIISSVFATYFVRLLDRLSRKNDRHSPKHGH